MNARKAGKFQGKSVKNLPKSTISDEKIVQPSEKADASNDPCAAQSQQPPTLVPNFHGLDAASKAIVVDALEEAFAPHITNIFSAKALWLDDGKIHLAAARRLRRVVMGEERPPSNKFARLARDKYGRGFRAEFNPASLRACEDIFIRALLPLVPNYEIASAVLDEDCLLLQASRRLIARFKKMQGARHD